MSARVIEKKERHMPMNLGDPSSLFNDYFAATNEARKSINRVDDEDDDLRSRGFSGRSGRMGRFDISFGFAVVVLLSRRKSRAAPPPPV